MPAGLKARIEEYVAVESKYDTEDWRHHYVPDVVVTESHQLSVAVIRQSQSLRLQHNLARQRATLSQRVLFLQSMRGGSFGEGHDLADLRS